MNEQTERRGQGRMALRLPLVVTGVAADSAVFVGLTLGGPLGDEPEPPASLVDFERVYGGLDQLSFCVETRPDFAARQPRRVKGLH